MPIYTLKDSTGTKKKVLIEIDEFLSYEKREDGSRVYTGQAWPESSGEIVFALSSSTKLNGETRMPAATRKFGDHYTSPAFGRKLWE